MRDPDDEHPGSGQLEALYRDSYQAIFAYVLRRTGADRETVADLTAEVFVVALRRPGAVPPPPEDLLWLFGVARRVVLDHQRRRGRMMRLLSRVQSQLPAGDDPDDSEPSRARVQAAMARLPEADREVLQLVFWDGLSHAEAGQVLGCTANAVALRLHKARGRLRQILSRPAGPARSSRRGGADLAPSSSRSQP